MAGVDSPVQLQPTATGFETYFLNIPKNIRNLEVSSGVFSETARALLGLDSEVVDDAAVEAGEAS